LEALVTFAGELGAGSGLEAIGQLEQLRREMVERPGLVVECSMLSMRVGRIVERGVQAAGDVEAAGGADHADGIEPVRILQDFRFERFRWDVGGEGMGEDGVGHGGYFIHRPAETREDGGRLVGGQARRLCPQR
jgi:hypothetical protein